MSFGFGFCFGCGLGPSRDLGDLLWDDDATEIVWDDGITALIWDT